MTRASNHYLMLSGISFLAVTWRMADGFITTHNIRRCRSYCSISKDPTELAGEAWANKGEKGKETFDQNMPKRYADFPRFAYRKTYSVNGEKKVVVCIQCRQDTASKMRSNTVSVPSRRERKATFLDALYYTLFGISPADGDFVSTSARQSRLLVDRAYARPDVFSSKNMNQPPCLDDISPPPKKMFDGFWISTPARCITCVLAYWAFPYITTIIDGFITMPFSQLDEISSKFGPGVSILYGTFISITLSILYNRQRLIQDHVAMECALLVNNLHNMLAIFKDLPDKAVLAGQCAADQIRTLVRSSRGTELMLLMYSDPYARMLELLHHHREYLYETERTLEKSSSLISRCQDTIHELYIVRANRLSDEALALPPTHFLILNILTFLIMLGYTLSIIPTVDSITGEPSNESCLVFAILCTMYILFYNFADDLNNPFTGVYQIRRSCAASHLLQAKWLIANHPLLRGRVDFDEVEDQDDIVLIRSPGLGDLWFEYDDIYLDSKAYESPANAKN